MNASAPLRVDEELWSNALLSADSELLLGAARNYLGPVKTPYDKREIVERLKAFLRRPDVRQAVMSLLDGLDARILGSCFLLGPVPEAELRSLFEGELPLFDLGIRIANLQDRLLLFRFEAGGRRLIAPNPVLAEDLEAVVLDPRAVFGPDGRAASAAEPGAAPAPAAQPPVSASDAVALFSFLFHAPAGIRKGGGLTKKAVERAQGLLPDVVRLSPERLPSLLSAFDAAGFLGAGAEGREPDLPVFQAALTAWAEALPAYLAAAMAAGPEAAADGLLEGPRHVAETAAAAAAALAAAPEGFLFSQGGLNRWMEIALRRASHGAEAEGAMERRDLVDALVSLGLVAEVEGGLKAQVPWRAAASGALALQAAGGDSGAGLADAADLGAAIADAAEPRAGAAKPRAPSLVAEGSHAIHLLPEADLEERLFVGVVARPVAFGTAWSFEVDRESARRAFSAGLGAADMIARLTAYAGRPLPQSLSFSLTAWEEEYRSLRLYRGFVLVADERLRPVVEHSKALAPRIAERLAPGVYVLAVSGPEEAAELIEEAGLEAPPETHYGPAGASPENRRDLGWDGGQALIPEPESPEASLRARAFARAAQAVAPLAALEWRPAPPELDPRARLAFLEAALDAAAFGISDAADFGPPTAQEKSLSSFQAKATVPRNLPELRELADRIERRLILTPRQLALAEVRPERLEATGLDYLGKVQIVQRALRSPGDRLELLYRLPGAEPTRVLVRPVRLEKTEKGLVLEAEDLNSGEPVRVSLGAASSVRRMRASLFGEDT
jgi:hypothetical protein